MCELFAINASRPVLANEYLREFYRHSEMHPHGWGIAWRDGDDITLHKEPVRALDSETLRRELARPLAKTNLIAHIRLATIGNTDYGNCHPFACTDESGIQWIMAHNGTIFNDALITGYENQGEGSTDSERIILFLMDLLDTAELRRGGELDASERFEVLNNAVVKLSNGNKLNVLIDDGTCLYVHTNTLAPTLYVLQGADYALFSTQPLDDDSRWQPVPAAQLHAYRKGKLVRQGRPHANIFVKCAPEDYLLVMGYAQAGAAQATGCASPLNRGQ